MTSGIMQAWIGVNDAGPLFIVASLFGMIGLLAMPRIDFALHPAALGFGLFCAMLAGMAIASMVYATAVEGRSERSVTSDEKPEREPFVPESEGGLPERETSSVDVDANATRARFAENGRSDRSASRSPSVRSN